jgi:hypothetical protein
LFICRLREVAEKISHHGFVNAPGFRAIRNLVITQCVVGPTYIALLLEVRSYVVTLTHNICKHIFFPRIFLLYNFNKSGFEAKEIF